MEDVDVAVIKMVGLSVHDLVDIDFYTMFDNGATPKSAAKKALKASGW